MFYNPYGHVQSLTVLKSITPYKRYLPDGPDLENFLTGSDELRLLANFGLEMMKFLPEFETWMYQNGDHQYVEGDDGYETSVEVESAGGTYNFDADWWSLFNDAYEISETDFNAGLYEDLLYVNGENGDDGTFSFSQWNSDGVDGISNEDTIAAVETLLDENGDAFETDGYGNWRDGQNWVYGQHHRVSSGNSEEFGAAIWGQGSGTCFENCC